MSVKAVCRCGWESPPRSHPREVYQDLVAHQREHFELEGVCYPSTIEAA